MANSRQIKRRITAAKNISKITKAMEMVAASKMKRSQDQAMAARPYAQALATSLSRLTTDINPGLHPLLSMHEDGIAILLILSTDKGLCGSLNTQLFKETMRWMKAYPDGQVIAVGRKAVHFARIMGLSLYAQFTQLPEKIALSDIVPITELIIDSYTNHTFSHVSMVYMDFINTLSQKTARQQLLPIQHLDTEEDYTIASPKVKSEYTFEPSSTELLNQVLPYYIENAIFQAFLESRASEHSARMVTMKNASENAGELVGELQLEFNKTRQASITTELLDITTASLTIS